MSEPDYDVPPGLRGGVWADDVEAYGDVDQLTLDFIRSSPRDDDDAVLVTRVALSGWCILKLHEELRRRIH